MKAVFSENYKDHQDEIIKIILNFNNTGTTLVKGSRNTIKSVQLSNGEIINIKSFKKPNLINQVVYRFFRKSKAARSFIYGSYLQDNGIGTPAPIAYLEFPYLLTFNTSYYICKHESFDFMYRELVHESHRFNDWESILRDFTKFTYHLHEKNIEFLDHSPGNTLITKMANAYRFSLVDLNRMNIRALDLESRIKNFAKLTHREDVIRIMSDEYAQLVHGDFEDIFQKMMFYTKQFQYKWHRKEIRKKKIKVFKAKLGL